MKNIHYLTGLPRSGSTLLCNILCQNPDFYASGTSPVGAIVNAARLAWSNAPEVKNQIDAEKEQYFNRFKAVGNGIIQNWYSIKEENTIFDKSRGWMVNHSILNKVDEPKYIICIRDLRDIVASVVKRTRETVLFDSSPPISTGQQVTNLMSPQGVLGGPLVGLQEIMAYGINEQLFFFNYSSFCQFPERTMKALYAFIDEPYFEHKFEDVKKAHNENDAMWHYTFPHEGTGKVQPNESKWENVINEDLGNELYNRNRWFFERFRIKK